MNEEASLWIDDVDASECECECVRELERSPECLFPLDAVDFLIIACSAKSLSPLPPLTGRGSTGPSGGVKNRRDCEDTDILWPFSAVVVVGGDEGCAVYDDGMLWPLEDGALPCW